MESLGAEVVRVRTPGVEPAPERALIFDAYKRSLELDLESEAGRQAARTLAAGADFWLESGIVFHASLADGEDVPEGALHRTIRGNYYAKKIITIQYS